MQVPAPVSDQAGDDEHTGCKGQQDNRQPFHVIGWHAWHIAEGRELRRLLVELKDRPEVAGETGVYEQQPHRDAQARRPRTRPPSSSSSASWWCRRWRPWPVWCCWASGSGCSSDSAASGLRLRPGCPGMAAHPPPGEGLAALRAPVRQLPDAERRRSPRCARSFRPVPPRHPRRVRPVRLRAGTRIGSDSHRHRMMRYRARSAC